MEPELFRVRRRIRRVELPREANLLRKTEKLTEIHFQ